MGTIKAQDTYPNRFRRRPVVLPTGWERDELARRLLRCHQALVDDGLGTAAEYLWLTALVPLQHAYLAEPD